MRERDDVKRIFTERLCLFPLEEPQLQMALRDPETLCEKLEIFPGKPYGFFEWRHKKKVYTAKLSIMKSHPRAWLLTTTWFIVSRDTSVLLGEIGFKGPPNMGEIEVGYGLKRDARNKGYMTEALELLCQVAAVQQEYPVEAVIAKTLKDNTPSHRVLEKNGFTRDGEVDKYWRWIKRVDGAHVRGGLAGSAS